MGSRMTSGRRRQAGFTYVLAMALVVLVGLGLVATAEFWSQTWKREKEAELIWVGNQMRQAIGRYYERSPGSMKRYPETLNDLLEDKRHLSVQRYLRKLYPDPMTGKADWGLLTAPGGGIMGVSSRAQGRPMGRLNHLSTETYAAWTFIYEPPAAAAGVAKAFQTPDAPPSRTTPGPVPSWD